MDSVQRDRQIREHLDAIRELQAAANADRVAPGWPPKGYYFLWHVMLGMVFGVIGAAVSLIANVVGAALTGRHPLELIRVYLTFPMGERALSHASGEVLTVGCVLYLITGAIYGIAFHIVISTFLANAPTGRRFLAATLMGLGLWVVNFYGILSWLQPVLLGGSWIVDMVPFWVAALTHLAFAWTILAVEFWGVFVPYQQTPFVANPPNGNAAARRS
ncbi:MAG: hypothetical protein K8S99_09945 [Planctomycetes bacterium]|nr:hypothetical protein [Planctomycetota bacterium]